MKTILFCLLACSPALAATQMIEVTVAPTTDGSYCKYESVLKFDYFPDYEVFSTRGPNTWVKSDRALTTVEVKSADQYELHLRPEPRMLEVNQTCKSIPLKVMIR